MEVDSAELEALFKRLSSDGTFRADRAGIHSSGLSPNDRPGIRSSVPLIAKAMYIFVRDAKIAFDAVASIPTGGDLYTQFFRTYAEQDGRPVPALLLDREGGKYVRRVRSSSDVPAKARILVIDDCIFTGRTMRHAKDVVVAANYKIAGFACGAELIHSGDRGLGRVPVVSVFDTKFAKRAA